MARMVNADLLDQKIEKAEQEVAKARKNYEVATSELKKLLDKRDAIRSQELLKMVSESPLSYNEIRELIMKAGRKEDE